MEKIRVLFNNLEIEHFNIINSYIMGMVSVADINRFQAILDDFRTKLYELEVNDDNLLEIAKMKSVVQHYNTEILEDEEVLKVAYSNSN
ncbi:MAG: hypothetical protein ACI4WW_03020 [Candidatus Coprovivens sp.]